MKLHPLSIPYRAATAVSQWLWIPIVAGVGLPSVLDGAVAVAAFGTIVIGVLLATVGWEVAYYRRYEYELTEDTLDIDAGVISRHSREIPYGRVQNVSIDRNVVQRALGLAEVRIDTAGGSGSEAHLQYVSNDRARWLQDELSERKRAERRREREQERAAGDARDGAATDRSADERRSGHDGPRSGHDERRSPLDEGEDGERAAVERADDAEPHADRRESLFDITSRELAVLGFVSLADVRALPILFFALASLQEVLLDWVLSRGPTTTLIALLGLAIVGGYLLIAGTRALYEVANYYGFELVRVDDELRYERGLLQKYSGSIPLAKVQALTVTEHVLARLVGYASLSLETAGFSPTDTAGSRSAIPIATRDRVESVAGRIEPIDVPEFERPPKRARERYVVRYALVVLAIVGLAYGLDQIGYWIGPWYAPLALLVLVPIAAHLKWRNLGYALTDDHVLTRHGFWSRTTKIVPYHRVQTVADSQTVFQRRRALATLHVDVAGSRSLVSDDSKAVDLDREVAAELRETVSERTLTALSERRTRHERHLDRVGADPVGTDAGVGGPGDGASAGGADD